MLLFSNNAVLLTAFPALDKTCARIGFAPSFMQALSSANYLKVSLPPDTVHHTPSHCLLGDVSSDSHISIHKEAAPNASTPSVLEGKAYCVCANSVTRDFPAHNHMQKLTTNPSVKFQIDPAAGREKELFLVTPAIQWELIDDGMPFLTLHITCRTRLTLF